MAAATSVPTTGRGGAAASVVGDASDRHVTRDSKTSPLHELPSYTQAMTGTGVTSKLTSVPRQRSASASVSVVLPVYSTHPAPLATSTKTATSSGDKVTLSPHRGATASSRSVGMDLNSGEVVSKLQSPQQQPQKKQRLQEERQQQEAQPQQQEAKHQQEVEQQKQEVQHQHKQNEKELPEIQHEQNVHEQEKEQPPPPMKQRVECWTDSTLSNGDGQTEEASSSSSLLIVEMESGDSKTVLPLAESEFARNIHGTSTPIDITPTVSSNENQTFDLHDNTTREPKTIVGVSNSMDTADMLVSSMEEISNTLTPS